MDGRGEDPKWTTYGWFKIRPAFLQRFHNVRYLTVGAVLAQLLHGLLIGGFLPLSIKMLTERFDMTREETSLITSSFEAASVSALIIVSHRGNYGHKGQWIGYGLLIFSTGAFLWTIPQYFIGPHTYGDWVKPVLHCTKSATVGGSRKLEGNLHLTVEHTKFVHHTFMFVFIIAEVLLAIGSAPLAVLLPAYIDESTSQRKSALYLSFLIAGIGVGELLGGAFGSVFMDIYGDIGKVDVEGISITPDHPNWYGAWWLGFLIAGILSILMAVLFLGFSYSLPSVEHEKSLDFDQRADHVEVINDYTVLSIPEAIWSLLRNRTYSSILGASMFYGAMLGSSALNLPYLLISYFHLSDNNAASSSAMLIILPQVIGVLIAGFLFYHLSYKLRRMLQLCSFVSMVVLVLTPTFLLYCEDPKMAGVSVDYVGKPSNGSNLHLEDGCNRACFPKCQPFRYEPVCHKASGTSFYSPCYAGCRRERNDDILIAKGWSNCRCTPGNTPDGGKVERGVCQASCSKHKLFIFFFILIGIATGMTLPGFQQGFLRSVGYEQRVMGLTLAFVFSRIFGMIPGQIIMKYLLEQACIVSDPLASRTCIIPDKPKLAEIFSTYYALIVGCMFLCFASASVVYKTKSNSGLPHKMEHTENEENVRNPSEIHDFTRPEEDQL